MPEKKCYRIHGILIEWSRSLKPRDSRRSCQTLETLTKPSNPIITNQLSTSKKNIHPKLNKWHQDEGFYKHIQSHLQKAFDYLVPSLAGPERQVDAITILSPRRSQPNPRVFYLRSGGCFFQVKWGKTSKKQMVLAGHRKDKKWCFI